MLFGEPDRATAKVRSTRAHTGSERRHKGRTTESIHRLNRQRRTRSDTQSGKSFVRGTDEAVAGEWPRQAAGLEPACGNRLGEDVLHHVAMHIRQPDVAPTEAIRQRGVIEAEQV